MINIEAVDESERMKDGVDKAVDDGDDASGSGTGSGLVTATLVLLTTTKVALMIDGWRVRSACQTKAGSSSLRPPIVAASPDRSVLRLR